MRSFVYVVGVMMCAASSVSLGQTVSHDAHVHGLAKLTLVAEADSITMQFESPAMNIVGFEHAPKTKAQLKAVEHALKKLNKPEALFSFKGGQCSFAGADVDSPFETHTAHKHHEHTEHHGEHESSEHREFVAEYQASCKKIAELKTIDFSLLKEFKGIETLELQYIISGQQGALNLTGSSSMLTLPN